MAQGRCARPHPREPDNEISRRLIEAEVDLGAIIDYASSFGTVALTRAYADWSVPANAAYKRQLIDRAVDLVQLFATSGTKNGADIRLSIDAVDDLFQHADITHVVVVGGDSDYIALAQRCKRMGRYVVGIGVTGSTSRALVAACDDFSSYGDLPGVDDTGVADESARRGIRAGDRGHVETGRQEDRHEQEGAGPEDDEGQGTPATTLLRRAIQVGAEKSDDGWQHSSSVKSQMQRWIRRSRRSRSASPRSARSWRVTMTWWRPRPWTTARWRSGCADSPNSTAAAGGRG